LTPIVRSSLLNFAKDSLKKQIIWLPSGAHPDQAVDVVAQPDQDLVAEAGGGARGDAVVQEEDGAVLDVPGL
jgi:hypothetical protein